MSRFSQAAFSSAPPQPAQFPPDAGVEVAFVGRSNAGKSSAINAITQRHGLARTSKTPGRTQLLNFFELGPERAPRRSAGLRLRGRARRASAAPGGRSSMHCASGHLARPVPHRGCAAGLQPRPTRSCSPGRPRRRRVHVLLAKADKLNRGEGAAALKAAASALAGRATVQLFSALRGNRRAGSAGHARSRAELPPERK